MLVCACFSRIHTKKCWVTECACYKFSWCQTALQLSYTNLHICQQEVKDQPSHQLANINNFLTCFPCIYILSARLGIENPESRPMMTSYLHIFPYSEVFSNWCSINACCRICNRKFFAHLCATHTKTFLRKLVGFVHTLPTEQITDIFHLKLPKIGFPPALLAGGSENRPGFLRQ